MEWVLPVALFLGVVPCLLSTHAGTRATVEVPSGLTSRAASSFWRYVKRLRAVYDGVCRPTIISGLVLPDLSVMV